jgi:hypothetical protein
MVTQGSGNDVQVLSTRGPSGWSSQVIEPPHAESVSTNLGQTEEYRFFSADLSRGVTFPLGAGLLALSPWATEATPYLRTDYLNGNVSEHCESSYQSASSCFVPLVSGCPAEPGACAPTVKEHADVPPGTVFGEESYGHCAHAECGPEFVDGTPDLSHVILYDRSRVQLTPTPGSGFYEWSDGQLQSLPGVPAGESPEGFIAKTELGRPHAISVNGQRVVLGCSTGICLRDTNLPSSGDPRAQTNLEVGAGIFQAASADDSRIFFTNGDLYEYDLEKPEGERVSDLTVDPYPPEAAGVGTVLGASEDGSYVYFTAAGRLTPDAVPGSHVYLRHDGVTTLVAPVGASVESAEVSPDGRWLAFMSAENLTGYNTRDASSGQPDQEVYLYGADTGRLVCASCDPTGARPTGFIYTVGGKTKSRGEFVDAPYEFSYGSSWIASNVPGWHKLYPAHYQPRYVSDGGRVFFNSLTPLVPQATNGVENVYEYEPSGFQDTEGHQQCTPASSTFSERSKGCVSLISSGTSAEDSVFLDSSESGSNVFFLTTSKLASQDYDTAYDVYDAHECTSISACPPAPAAEPPPCVTEASCKLSPTPQPSIFGASGSATFSGPGNPTPPAPAVVKPKAKVVKCKKGLVKNKQGKCTKRPKKRNKHKAKKSAKGRA